MDRRRSTIVGSTEEESARRSIDVEGKVCFSIFLGLPPDANSGASINVGSQVWVRSGRQMVSRRSSLSGATSPAPPEQDMLERAEVTEVGEGRVTTIPAGSVRLKLASGRNMTCDLASCWTDEALNEDAKECSAYEKTFEEFIFDYGVLKLLLGSLPDLASKEPKELTRLLLQGIGKPRSTDKQQYFIGATHVSITVPMLQRSDWMRMRMKKIATASAQKVQAAMDARRSTVEFNLAQHRVISMQAMARRRKVLGPIFVNQQLKQKAMRKLQDVASNRSFLDDLRRKRWATLEIQRHVRGYQARCERIRRSKVRCQPVAHELIYAACLTYDARMHLQRRSAEDCIRMRVSACAVFQRALRVNEARKLLLHGRAVWAAQTIQRCRRGILGCRKAMALLKERRAIAGQELRVYLEVMRCRLRLAEEKKMKGFQLAGKALATSRSLNYLMEFTGRYHQPRQPTPPPTSVAFRPKLRTPEMTPRRRISTILIERNDLARKDAGTVGVSVVRSNAVPAQPAQPSRPTTLLLLKGVDQSVDDDRTPRTKDSSARSGISGGASGRRGGTPRSDRLSSFPREGSAPSTARSVAAARKTLSEQHSTGMSPTELKRWLNQARQDGLSRPKISASRGSLALSGAGSAKDSKDNASNISKEDMLPSHLSILANGRYVPKAHAHWAERLGTLDQLLKREDDEVRHVQAVNPHRIDVSALGLLVPVAGLATNHSSCSTFVGTPSVHAGSNGELSPGFVAAAVNREDCYQLDGAFHDSETSRDILNAAMDVVNCDRVPSPGALGTSASIGTFGGWSAPSASTGSLGVLDRRSTPQRNVCHRYLGGPPINHVFTPLARCESSAGGGAGGGRGGGGGERGGGGGRAGGGRGGGGRGGGSSISVIGANGGIRPLKRSQSDASARGFQAAGNLPTRGSATIGKG